MYHIHIAYCSTRALVSAHQVTLQVAYIHVIIVRISVLHLHTMYHMSIVQHTCTCTCIYVGVHFEGKATVHNHTFIAMACVRYVPC